MSPDTQPDSTPDHPALVLLYLAGGLLVAAVGSALLYVGSRPTHHFGDTLPFDLIVGWVLVPFGLLSVLASLAMHRRWPSRAVFRLLPIVWLVAAPIVAILWL